MGKFSEIDIIVQEKIRKWRSEAGAQSVLIDDLPDEDYQQIVDGFKKRGH